MECNKFIDAQYRQYQFINSIIDACQRGLKSSRGIGPLHEVIHCTIPHFNYLKSLFNEETGSVWLKNVNYTKTYLSTKIALEISKK